MPKKRETSFEDHNITCPNPKCGRAFSITLRTEDLSFDPPHLYGACPYCLTEIPTESSPPITEKHASNVERLEEAKESEEAEEVTETEESKQPQPTQPPGCSRGIGFLSTRSSKEPIPDECMICANIVQCMLKKVSE